MWDEVGFVICSKKRTKILKSLDESPKIPSKIAEDLGLKINFISHEIRDLKDHNLVVCINPEVRKGKVYKLTDLGKKVVDKI